MLGPVVGRCIPPKPPGPHAAHASLGLVLVGSGCVLTELAMRARRRRAVGEFDLANPRSLVTEGPHALGRKPMYVGWWFIHLGCGCGFGIARGSPLVFVTLQLAALAEHSTARAEEWILSRQFGSSAVRQFGTEFDVYVMRVPRYLSRGSIGIGR